MFLVHDVPGKGPIDDKPSGHRVGENLGKNPN
jgi:hypothetical protein